MTEKREPREVERSTVSSVQERALGVDEMHGAGAIRTRPFVLIYLAFTFIALGNFIPLVHLVPYAMDQGVSRETAVILLSLDQPSLITVASPVTPVAEAD